MLLHPKQIQPSIKVFLTPASFLSSLGLISSGKFACCFSCCHRSKLQHPPCPSVSPHQDAALTELGTHYEAARLCTSKHLGLWLSFLLCYLHCSPKRISLSHYSKSCILQNWCCAGLFAFSFSSLAFCSRVLPH